MVRSFTKLVLVFACAALGGFSAASAADAPVTQPASPPTTRPADPVMMGRWLRDLASPEFVVRDAARTQLMHLSRQDLPALQELVRKVSPLSPPQALALRQIVQEVYLAGEPYDASGNHGFLGILMDEAAMSTRDLQQPNDTGIIPGVVVADRIPGFCASRMLRDGDVILGTVEPAQVFNSSNDLKNVIGSLEPGTLVHLQVLRQGQVIEVPLTLDRRPVEADENFAENFRFRRGEKFKEYWRHTFAPLLRESVG
ncbi:MAG TPA: hypothetical protein VLJ39_23065 [Tepidisphaeraceae bacterium]|nr:hypothetical protein [Tepidisphaeraceae bacterium]